MYDVTIYRNLSVATAKALFETIFTLLVPSNSLCHVKMLVTI